MIEIVVIALGIVTVLWIVHDVNKNADKLHYVYLPAPTIGSVRPPVLQQVGPITNEQGSPWLGGGAAPSWSYDMMGG